MILSFIKKGDKMDWIAIFKSNYVRILVSLQHLVFSRELIWLNFALPIIFIVSLINRAKHLKNSILKGSVIGILSWLFFFTYEYIDASSSGYVDWGFFLGLRIFVFMPLLLISSIIGMAISYFVRKQIRNKKITSQ